MTARIGLLGGYGAVGALIAERLHKQGAGDLLIAGRDATAGRALIADRLGGAGEFAQLDLMDADALARFGERCTVLVNCAGPTRLILDRVALAARRAGVPYVDIGGDHPVHARLAGAHDWCAVLSAGMIPGLTGLLPRHLARGCDVIESLTVYHGARDTFGYSSAYDYVVGIRDGDDVPLAAWRNGPALDAVRRQTDIRLPHFREPVTAQPYLSPEARRSATNLGLGSGTWYAVLEGERLPGLLQQIPGSAESEVPSLTEKVRQAAEFDVLGRARHATMLFQLDGKTAGQPVTRSLVLRADSAAALVAAAAVPAIVAVAADRIGPGVHFAAEVLAPDRVVDDLAADPAVVHLSEHDTALDELIALDEGTI
ncbi:saccharopine dehydrogenase NADP-binding domain-containing protein [Nocardia iowensis]|uniref:Saccharopine dehydrogenase NADP-binding domain-containing protein n=1 Tax=Nocardia iowensis TaxID=204891 RepID=A0ABX8RNX5_NOCIO|nr:saccharopine dehydrogenase NADP-binding domain-containing protein [Nocardia iowensis]QXN90702.1 saccharopine dehydrogenase NADP-binding domain-containing protein [Nocardia iowensis]